MRYVVPVVSTTVNSVPVTEAACKSAQATSPSGEVFVHEAPTARVFPLKLAIPPFMLVSSGVAPAYWKVMYGEPGTRYDVMVAEPWKYWTVTAWVSHPVVLWFAKVPGASTKDARQSVCVGCWIDEPSNLREVETPKTTP
jgi:hypothetical protein